MFLCWNYIFGKAQSAAVPTTANLARRIESVIGARRPGRTTKGIQRKVQLKRRQKLPNGDRKYASKHVSFGELPFPDELGNYVLKMRSVRASGQGCHES